MHTDISNLTLWINVGWGYHIIGLQSKKSNQNVMISQNMKNYKFIYIFLLITITIWVILYYFVFKNWKNISTFAGINVSIARTGYNNCYWNDRANRKRLTPKKSHIAQWFPCWDCVVSARSVNAKWQIKWQVLITYKRLWYFFQFTQAQLIPKW